jgi:hypothetical protein
MINPTKFHFKNSKAFPLLPFFPSLSLEKLLDIFFLHRLRNKSVRRLPPSKRRSKSLRLMTVNDSSEVSLELSPTAVTILYRIKAQISPSAHVVQGLRTI